MPEYPGVERLVEFADALVDDPAHIIKYRAIGLAERQPAVLPQVCPFFVYRISAYVSSEQHGSFLSICD
jgi:hypothetical protein